MRKLFELFCQKHDAEGTEWVEQHLWNEWTGYVLDWDASSDGNIVCPFPPRMLPY